MKDPPSSQRRVEVVHESLLSEWPRLVRWRAQDEEGAVLRDQLRQTAQMWEGRERSEDLLWTGTAFREYQLWRERYTGGLTELEESFAAAMTRKAHRQRRRRRLALTATIAALTGIVLLVGALWRQAVEESRRREAAQLVSLGRLQLDRNPTESVAYALASLEREDTREARLFALEALSRGPTALVLPSGANSVAFDPEGRWLAVGAYQRGVSVWPRDGGAPIALELGPGSLPTTSFSSAGDFVSVRQANMVSWFSMPAGDMLRTFDLAESPWARFVQWARTSRGSRRPKTESEARSLAPWWSREFADWDLSSDGERVTWTIGKDIYLSALSDLLAEPPRIAAQHTADVVWTGFHGESDRLVSLDEAGEIRLQATEDDSGGPTHRRRLQASPGSVMLATDADLSTLATSLGTEASGLVATIWDLGGPPDAEPLDLHFGETIVNSVAISADGLWMASGNNSLGTIWSLDRSLPTVLRGHGGVLAFTPDGRWLVSTDGEIVRRWPLSTDVADTYEDLLEVEGAYLIVHDMDASGRNLAAVSRWDGSLFLVPLDGDEPRKLERAARGWMGTPAFSPDGRRIVAISQPDRTTGSNILEMWNLEDGSVLGREFRSEHTTCGDLWYHDTHFLPDGRLLTAGSEGLLLWGEDGGTSRLLSPCQADTVSQLAGGANSRFVLLETAIDEQRPARLTWYDVANGESREIGSHGGRFDPEGAPFALDPSGEILVTGDPDGVVRVGPVTGEEPHLLYGHEHSIIALAVSPDSQWIASSSADDTIRLWPMPVGEPSHLRSKEAFLKYLRMSTNMRVVPDEATETGFRLEIAPFPGWEEVPEW